eukprot:417324-Pelagomonas_calceolata.AAC.2
MARLVEGVGSADNPTHTQENCVESDLSTLELFAQFTVSPLLQTVCSAQCSQLGFVLALQRYGARGSHMDLQ